MSTVTPTTPTASAMRHSFVVIGMHCQSCVAKISSALQRVDGVEAARVTLQPPQASIDMRRHIPARELNDAVAAVGDYKLSETAGEASPTRAAESEQKPEGLYPLFLIVGYILGSVLLVALATGHWSLHALMSHFMGGFFLVFSFFKLLDLRGFAMAYRSYDVVARAWPAWAFAYPFVELALGAAYLTGWQPSAINVVTSVLMLVSGVGVLQALMRKSAIRCACLGTVLSLPMTTVTLVEDLGMAVMAAAMLILAR